MTDTSDKPDKPTETARAACTEDGMRDTLINLEEFALMMSQRSSIRALEILEVVPPGQDKPPAPPAQTQAASVVPHPAVHKKGD